MAIKFPQWGIFGWIGFVIYMILIILGFIIAAIGCVVAQALLNQNNYSGISLIGVGFAVIAFGWNLTVTQFNQFNSIELSNMIKDMKKQLDRIESK